MQRFQNVQLADAHKFEIHRLLNYLDYFINFAITSLMFMISSEVFFHFNP